MKIHCIASKQLAAQDLLLAYHGSFPKASFASSQESCMRGDIGFLKNCEAVFRCSSTRCSEYDAVCVYGKIAFLKQ